MKRRDAYETDAALAEVRAVYAALEARPVERNCVRLKECCHFKLTGRTPFLTKGEALLAAKAFRATGRKALPDNAEGDLPDAGIGHGQLPDLRAAAVRLPDAFLRGRGRSLCAARGAGFDSPAGGGRCLVRRRGRAAAGPAVAEALRG